MHAVDGHAVEIVARHVARCKTDSSSVNTACRKAARSMVAQTRATSALVAVLGRINSGAITGVAIPPMVADALHDNTDTAPPTTQTALTVDRIANWLLANPWELMKCRSLPAALNAVSQCCRPASNDEEVQTVAEQAAKLLGGGPTFTELKEQVHVPSIGCKVLCRDGGKGLKLVHEHVDQALLECRLQVAMDKCSLKLKRGADREAGATLLAKVRVLHQPSLVSTAAGTSSALDPEAGSAELSARLRDALRHALLQVQVTCASLTLPAELVRYVIGRGGWSIKQVERTIVARLNVACSSEQGIASCDIVTVGCTSSLRAATFAPAIRASVRLTIVQDELRAVSERARAVWESARDTRAARAAHWLSRPLTQIPASELDGSACKERRARKRFLDANRKHRARERCAKGSAGPPCGSQLARGPTKTGTVRRTCAAVARFNRRMGWTCMDATDKKALSGSLHGDASEAPQIKLALIRRKRVSYRGRDLSRWRSFSLSCDDDQF
uniref:K Homology domain-containing protein n=1 Tax=Haptolina ericina TaxID=156174 RepID=A0A7S3F4X4_9EUKA